MESIEIGNSKKVNKLFRFMEDRKKETIEDYYISSITNPYHQFILDRDITCALENKNEYSNEELEIIREYSGYNFRQMNNALRGTWNYEQNGHIQSQQRFLEDSEKLSRIIESHPLNIGNIKVFRGVTLEYFKEYGIAELKNLNYLEGKFLYDAGFISTSLLEDSCFFGRSSVFGEDYNIKITYLVPNEFDDAIILQTKNMSYSPKQREYLINHGNIAKVSSVIVKDDNTAYITALLIPKKIYDSYYDRIEKNKGK